MVIHKDHTKRIKWKTGVVIGLNPGKDGVVRRVLLCTANGKVFDRPVQRLHPIEVEAVDGVTAQPAQLRQSQDSHGRFQSGIGP